MAKKGRLFPDHIARKQMLKKMMQLEGIASVKTLKQKKKKKKHGAFQEQIISIRPKHTE